MNLEDTTEQRLRKKTARALELGTAAGTKVGHLFKRAEDCLIKYNQRLAVLTADIEASQPMESGSVGLYLLPCSKEGCRGCPHPRWVKYIWRSNPRDGKEQLVTVNLNAERKDPVMVLKRKYDGHERTKSLIQEAKYILKLRSKLIASLRTIEYAVIAGEA